MPLYIYQFERTLLPKSPCILSVFRCRDVPVLTVSMLVSADPDIAAGNSPLIVIVTYQRRYGNAVRAPTRVFLVLFLASSIVYKTRPTRLWSSAYVCNTGISVPWNSE